MSTLHILSKLSLPKEAVALTFAILAVFCVAEPEVEPRHPGLSFVRTKALTEPEVEPREPGLLRLIKVEDNGHRLVLEGEGNSWDLKVDGFRATKSLGIVAPKGVLCRFQITVKMSLQSACMAESQKLYRFLPPASMRLFFDRSENALAHARGTFALVTVSGPDGKEERGLSWVSNCLVLFKFRIEIISRTG